MPTKKKGAKKATKKVAKKTVAPKKKSAKSTRTKAAPTAKKNTKKALVCAKGKECFWTTDGQVISNLIELGDSLEKMADKVFKYHVTKEKNDFADWVEGVLKDAELGKTLRKSRKPSSARTVVVRRLKIYNF